MSNGAELLRLLEPAVRPGNLPSASHRCEPPIEQRDFETLLSAAKESDSKVSCEQPTQEPTTPIARRLLGQLSSVDQIANPDLLAILTRPDSAMNEPTTRTDSGNMK